MAKWNYDTRKIFNNCVIEEVLMDCHYLNIYPQTILDIGCGDGFLLFKIKEKYPDAQVFCIERNFMKRDGITYIDYKDISKLNLDIVFLIDVIYLIPRNELFNIFQVIKRSLKRDGIIYILLGIYKESKGIKVLNPFIKELEVTIYNHSIKDILYIFNDLGFDIHIKKLDFSKTFGIKIPVLLIDDIEDFIDYLYNEKLIIKLTVP